MNTGRPRPVLADQARVVRLARGPEPEGVTSNVGHPDDPVVIGLCVDGPELIVVLSEGSGHLGSGGTFRLDEVLVGSGALQARWETVFERADARWVVPLLARLATDRSLAEQAVTAAYRRRHGTDPVIGTGSTI